MVGGASHSECRRVVGESGLCVVCRGRGVAGENGSEGVSRSGAKACICRVNLKGVLWIVGRVVG